MWTDVDLGPYLGCYGQIIWILAVLYIYAPEIPISKFNSVRVFYLPSKSCPRDPYLKCSPTHDIKWKYLSRNTSRNIYVLSVETPPTIYVRAVETSRTMYVLSVETSRTIYVLSIETSPTIYVHSVTTPPTTYVLSVETPLTTYVLCRHISYHLRCLSSYYVYTSVLPSLIQWYYFLYSYCLVYL